jgi:hypothetical protein
LARSGHAAHAAHASECLLLGVKRTSRGPASMSGFDPKATSVAGHLLAAHNSKKLPGPMALEARTLGELQQAKPLVWGERNN